jgi:hypothetical protein
MVGEGCDAGRWSGGCLLSSVGGTGPGRLCPRRGCYSDLFADIVAPAGGAEGGDAGEGERREGKLGGEGEGRKRGREGRQEGGRGQAAEAPMGKAAEAPMGKAAEAPMGRAAEAPEGTGRGGADGEGRGGADGEGPRTRRWAGTTADPSKRSDPAGTPFGRHAVVRQQDDWRRRGSAQHTSSPALGGTRCSTGGGHTPQGFGRLDFVAPVCTPGTRHRLSSRVLSLGRGVPSPADPTPRNGRTFARGLPFRLLRSRVLSTALPSSAFRRQRSTPLRELSKIRHKTPGATHERAA